MSFNQNLFIHFKLKGKSLYYLNILYSFSYDEMTSKVFKSKQKKESKSI